MSKADYESELRVLLAERHGSDAVDEVFPDHTQTRVRGLKER
jgi:predicted subunit of tRNA(5-methylaminomethyl-2-thiouridylate) methyltransferase